MQDQRAALELQQQYLARRPTAHALAGQLCGERRIDRPAQARIVDAQLADAARRARRARCRAAWSRPRVIPALRQHPRRRQRLARLLDLGFLERDVLAHDRVELAHFHLVRDAGACSSWLRRNEPVPADDSSLIFSRMDDLRCSCRGGAGPPVPPAVPSSRWCACPLVDTRSVTQRFSSSSQKRCVCRFGKKRRRRRLLAWETVFPVRAACR